MTEYSRSRLALAPVCLNCRDTLHAVSLMKGPIPDPSGLSPELVFVCERCGDTMKDRRRLQQLLDTSDRTGQSE